MTDIFRRQTFTVDRARQSQVFDAPNGHDVFRLAIDRPRTGRSVPWTADQHIRVTIMVSADGGRTWLELTSFTTHGGSHDDEDQCVHLCQLDPGDAVRSANGRKVRVDIEPLSGAPDLTVDFESFASNGESFDDTVRRLM